MVTSERRTRGDLVAVAAIVVVAIAATTVLWRLSDARATVSRTAAGEPAALASPAALPPSFAQVWSAPSAATTVPVVAGSTVVTADGREVVGRDPFTGEPRWHYARDIDLCTTASAWGNALSVWSKNPRYCSEVTALDGDTGRRANQRNGDAAKGSRLLFDGTHATAVGSTYLETWRSDLVRTTQYGAVPTPVNPGKQPRSGCSYVSAAAAANQVAVIERCPDETRSGDRLTVLKANPKEAEQPEVIFSVVLGAPAALVVATSDQRTAVLMPDPNRLAVYDQKGRQVGIHRVDVPAPTAVAGGPSIADITTSPSGTFWFTGSSTVALDSAEFRPQWTVGGTLGAGVIFAGRLLVPARNQLLVVDTANGARVGATPVDRGGHAGPVRLAAAGPVLLEQRGTLLVALR